MNLVWMANGTEAALVRLARRQFGVFSRDQARKLGISDAWMLRRVRSGLLIREYSNIFRYAAVPPSFHQALKAVCLRSPGNTWVSHRGAGGFWELDGVSTGIVEVTSTMDLRVDSSRVIVHRIKEMPRQDVTEVRGIPITTVHRTLLDLGAMLDADEVEMALECALRRRITTIPRLHRRLAEVGGPGRRGTGALRTVLARRDTNAAPTGSPLETMFLQLLRRYRLPEPVRQRVVKDSTGEVARVDFEYVDAEVVIEVDSRKHHLGAGGWERDLRRYNRLVSAGKRVLRVTDKRMKTDPDGLIGEIRAALQLSPQSSLHNPRRSA